MNSNAPTNDAVVGLLIRKDLKIMRKALVLWWLLGIAAIVLVIAVDNDTVAIFALIMFITGVGGAAIHAIMQTIVEERREQTLAFIMSLPVTIADYTSAKVAANMIMFIPVWLSLSVASLVVFIDGLSPGTFPFYAIILVSIFVAYTMMLTVSLVFETIGPAIFTMVVANVGTQAFLWWVGSLDGIKSVRDLPTVQWNATSLTILACQIGAIFALIGATYYFQGRKTDFL